MESVPNVINDAITAVIKLGYSYLWVDQYCISQNEGPEMMDVIYRQAEATICAVVGENASYGLPGVGSAARVVQPSVTVKGVQMVSTMFTQARIIQESKWSTRGWIFQEAVLSYRRIMFTAEQAYFECNGMNCYETVKCPLDLLPFPSYDPPFSRSRKIFTILDRSTEVDLKGSDICWGLLKLYTKRNLSHDSDSLQAFAGLTSLLSRYDTPLWFFWGIPLYRKCESRDIDFFSGLCWQHVHGYNAPGELTQSRRREEFPSWSWAGWQGEIKPSYGR